MLNFSVFDEINIQSLQVETAKKTLILHGTKTSGVLNSLLSEIYHLKKDNSVKFSRKNDNIRPFESGGETSLEFFSLKTDCSLLVVCSHHTPTCFCYSFLFLIDFFGSALVVRMICEFKV